MAKMSLIPLQGLLLIGLTAAAPSALANEVQCHTANQDTGVLAFNGVTEGRGFDGKFEDFSVRMCLEGVDLTTASIEVAVETASADTNSRDRDQTLKGEEFFWVSQFPQAQWSSQSITATGGDFSHEAQGILVIKDIRQDQAVSMRLVTDGPTPRLQGEAEIFRLDYNVGTGEFADTGFIENRVGVTFDLELVPESQ